MKRLVDQVIAPLAVAAITATAILLFNINGRLTRVETKLETLSVPPSHASHPSPSLTTTP